MDFRSKQSGDCSGVDLLRFESIIKRGTSLTKGKITEVKETVKAVQLGG